MKTFIKNITAATNVEEIIKIFQEFAHAKGIKSFTFTYYSLNPSSKVKLNYEYASPSIRRWHDYYLESGYEDIDQTLRWSRQAILPVVWDVALQLQQAKTIREKRLRQESLNFGIVGGVSIPIHGPQDDFATLALYQLKSEPSIDKTNIHEWVSVAYYLYAALQNKLRKRKGSTNKYNLTTREMQCLQLTIKNYSATEIARTFTISVRTVHYHMQNVNKKMGTQNKYQAVVKAINERIF